MPQGQNWRWKWASISNQPLESLSIDFVAVAKNEKFRARMQSYQLVINESCGYRIFFIKNFVTILTKWIFPAGFIDFDDINLEKSYTPQKAYDQSKLANVLFINELVRRLEGKVFEKISFWEGLFRLSNIGFTDSNIKGINVYSLHPGVIASNLHRHFDTAFFPGATFLASHLGSYFLKTVEQGAQTTIHCAADEDAGNETGLYYMWVNTN